MTTSRRMIRRITSAALLLSSSAVVAQDMPALPTTCSCSPTILTFTLTLDGSCEINDFETNSGIGGSFCFVEQGVTVPGGPPPIVEAAADVPDQPMPEPMCSFCPDGLTVDETFPLPSNATCGSAKAFAGSLLAEDDMCGTVKMAEGVCCGTTKDGPVRRMKSTTIHGRRLQVDPVTTAEDGDPVVEIVSVQFLEFDTSGDLTVINQDDSYADVSLKNGDRLKFMSASSFLDTDLPLDDQMSSPALVPGGASLILYGKTASGVVVRNRFFWMYDMNCGRENSPVNIGDKIGWVTVGDIANAWPVFCPALPEDSPTISPRTNEPTLVPSKSPTLKPSMMSMPPHTMSPTGKMVPTHKPTHNPNYVPPAFSKSNKQPKTPKPGKSGKSSHSKSAKSSSKSGKGHKSSKAGSSHDMQGKTGKEMHVGAYNMERLSGFEIKNANGVESMFGSSGMVGFVVSLVAGAVFLSRQ